jgi:two-component system, OmpR family, sensor kinase
MNRAFISLYLIVVLSIVLLGLALNKTWESVNPEDEIDPITSDFISLVEKKFIRTQGKKIILSPEIKQISFGSQVQLVTLDEFSDTEMLGSIKSGVVVKTGNYTELFYYKRISGSDAVLAVNVKRNEPKKTPLYVGFILLFYSAIAVIIFLWVWPLSRDLAKLAEHTLAFGKDGSSKTIAISTRSVLYPFVKSFNQMALRISELMTSQKEMTYAASHELRTPLARMKFALAIAEEQEVSVAIQKQLASIRQDVFDMESLINSLLNYAAFERQTQQLDQPPGHIQDLLQEIVARATIHKKNAIRIVIRDETEAEEFHCEWSLMQTALQNVVNNALDFAKTTIVMHVKITIQNYIIQIEDDGHGVPPDQYERIFESFTRLYSEGVSRSGFGLGLAIVRRIMLWHGGTATCAQGELGGSLFTLSWPRNQYQVVRQIDLRGRGSRERLVKID